MEECKRQVGEKGYPKPEELPFDPGRLLFRAAQLIRFYEALNNPEIIRQETVHFGAGQNMAFVTLYCTMSSRRTAAQGRGSPDIHVCDGGLFTFNEAAVTCSNCKSKLAVERGV